MRKRKNKVFIKVGIFSEDETIGDSIEVNVPVSWIKDKTTVLTVYLKKVVEKLYENQ